MNNQAILKSKNDYVIRLLELLDKIKTLNDLMFPLVSEAIATGLLDITKGNVVYVVTGVELKMVKTALSSGETSEKACNRFFFTFLSQFSDYAALFVKDLYNAEFSQAKEILQLFDDIGNGVVTLSEKITGPNKNIYWLPTRELFRLKKLHKLSV